VKSKTILMVGGYGTTGRILTRLLLQRTDCRLVLAGRNREKAERAAAEFNRWFAGDRVTATFVDAADETSLRRALDGVDLLLLASSTSEYTDRIAAAVLDARADYLDLQYSSTKLATLQALAGQIEAAGCCFITDAGFHPGLPAALVRYVASQFDRLERASVGSVIKVDWVGLDLAQATAEELLREMRDFRTLSFRDGAWRDAGVLSMLWPQRVDFSGQFGRQYVVPMFLEEMRALPDMCPTLRETGFYVGGFNWFVDWLAMPVILAALRLQPERWLPAMSRFMLWGLKRFSKPPYGTLLKVEASGATQSN
jgi:saccharopine dehydrogenase-like NADP-dependent oxidoreductase